MQRSPLTAREETEFWIRWKRGESVPVIGRALGRQWTTLAGYVTAHGGIPPPVRRRSARVLTTAEREDISRGLAAHTPCRTIAAAPKTGRVCRVALSSGDRLMRFEREAKTLATIGRLAPLRLAWGRRRG